MRVMTTTINATAWTSARPSPAAVHHRIPLAALALALGFAAGCGDTKPECPNCDTLVVAATGEPGVLVPPLIQDAVGRDITDLVYERLAVLRRGASPVDTAGYQPGLATTWQRLDSLTWRFRLRPGAKWQDGQPVLPSDVVFSFEAYTDTTLGAPAGEALEGVTVSADGADGVQIKFPRSYSEQLYDATAQVRILPRHVWDPKLRSAWGADSGVGALIGSGPYRIASWIRGQSLTAAAIDSTGAGFKRVIWRFARDPDGALDLVLSGEADLMETVTSPAARARVATNPKVKTVSYPSAVQGFLGFRHADAGGPHPILGDRAVRLALAWSVDRENLIHAVIGPDAVAPPGPVSRAIWIYNDSLKAPGFDPDRARRLLDSAGWKAGSDGIRSKAGRRLTLGILVPSTSTARKQLAEGIQHMWKAVGVAAEITAVDFSVFQERLRQGKFDTMIGAWLDDPSPRNLANQWATRGIGVQNFGRYSSPVFDSLFAAAQSARNAEDARRGWNEALEALTGDAAAIFLYTPTNLAVLGSGLSGVTIDPFSWLHDVRDWRKNGQ